MRRIALSVLLFLTMTCSSPAQFLPAHELYSSVLGVEIGLRLSANALPNILVALDYHDNSIQQGERFASLDLSKDALDLNKPVFGSTVVKFRLPGCNLWHEQSAEFQFADGTLQISGQVNPADLWNQECKNALAGSALPISVRFPKLTTDDRIKFGLLSNPTRMTECNVVPGRNNDLTKLVGAKLTVFPNGWAHDADIFRVASRPFTDMHINSLGQIGPGNWAIKDFDVFDLGDQVEVKNIVSAPHPGSYAGVRAYLVEVARKDGKAGIVDLDQLIAGDVTKCDPVQLIGPKRLLGGVFVKLKPGAKPVIDVSRTWVNDALVKFGYCQDFINGRFQCQTREYAKADLHADTWSAQYDEVEILTALP